MNFLVMFCWKFQWECDLQSVMRVAYTLFALFCLQSLVAAQERSQVSGKLIFERRLPVSALREAPIVLEPTPLLTFSDEDHLAAAYVSRDRTALTTRQEPAYSLRVLMLDNRGQQIAEGAFPTQTTSSRGLFAGGSDKFVVFANGRLGLVSAELKLEKNVTLSNGAQRKVAILPSGDRQTILTVKNEGAATLADLWNANSLEKISSCKLAGTWEIPNSLLNDQGARLLPDTASAVETQEIAVGKVCGQRNVVYSWHGNLEFPAIVTADTIVLAGDYSHFRVIHVGEGVVKEEHFGKHDFVDAEIRRSADGAIFAAAIKKFSGGSSFFDISPHLSNLRIVVFKSQDVSRIAEIRVPHTPKNRFDFALSPKGSRIAILADDYLQVFSL